MPFQIADKASRTNVSLTGRNACEYELQIGQPEERHNKDESNKDQPHEIAEKLMAVKMTFVALGGHTQLLSRSLLICVGQPDLSGNVKTPVPAMLVPVLAMSAWGQNQNPPVPKFGDYPVKEVFKGTPVAPSSQRQRAKIPHRDSARRGQRVGC
jgi:hypothetical protein